MTELRPLLESTKDDLERALLMSARAELPSGLGLRDTALALGLAGPTAEALATSLTAASSLSQAGAPLASTTAASTTAATSGGVPSAVGAASLGIMGKSLLGGALVSFLALTTLDYSLRSSPSRPDPVLVVNRVTAVSRAPDVPPALPAPAIPPVSPDADPASAPAVVVSGGVAPRSALSRLKPSVPALAPAPAPVPAPSNEAVVLPPPPPQPSRVTPNVSLAAEIRLLDQARAALAAGDSTYAAALLDRYAANRPSAVLAQEAALLRVRLLIKQGDRRGATQLARRIILEYPESRHVHSLRSLAAEP